MTKQEILFRMFICAYMNWTLVDDEYVLNIFDLEEYSASKIIDLFPREIEPESFNAKASDTFVRFIRSEMVECFLYSPNENSSHGAKASKVKITILDT